MDGAVDQLISIISKFADDSKVGNVVNTASQTKNLQLALDKLSAWSDKWNMKFNEKKCHVVHIGRNNPKTLYHINSIPLERSECEKDVGVWISETLKPEEQCKKAAWTANKVLELMCRSVLYRDKKIWPKLYMTYVRPYLEYAVPAWSPWLEKDIAIIEKVQERA